MPMGRPDGHVEKGTSKVHNTEVLCVCVCVFSLFIKLIQAFPIRITLRGYSENGMTNTIDNEYSMSI